jgi:hypothetical protein
VQGEKTVLVLPAIAVPVDPGADPRNVPAKKPPPPLERAVRQLRGRDPRFLQVSAEVRGGLVYVSGPATAAQEVFAFAQAVAELPGVERVVLVDKNHPD